MILRGECNRLIIYAGFGTKGVELPGCYQRARGFDHWLVSLLVLSIR